MIKIVLILNKNIFVEEEKSPRSLFMPYNKVKTYAERNIIHRTPKMKNMILGLFHFHWEKKKKTHTMHRNTIS